MRACPSEVSTGVLMSTPMRSVRSPARTVSGHAAVSPSIVMNSRRYMPYPKLRRRHLSGSNEYFNTG